MTTDFDNVKDPDDDLELGIDFHDKLVIQATPRTEYSQGAVLYFPQDTGFYYRVSTAGKTSAGYPRDLPSTAGQTVNYGSCVLTCVHPSQASLNSIDSVTWIVPTGVTKASQRIDGFIAFITLSGGTDGSDYDVTCQMTPTSGYQIDKTITVSVRSE